MVQKLLIITTFCLVVFTSVWAQTPPTIGVGSISNPYQIATSENLIWLSQNSSEWNKHYKQIADIAFAESSTQDWGNEDNGPETTGFSPIGNLTIPFSGSYNGGGHEIDGLYINNSTNEYIALFGVVISDSKADTVLIKNIGIGANSTIISNRRDHTLIYVAALVGFAFNPIAIDSCYNKGSISAATYSYCITAGLVANAGSLVISNSYNSGSVSSSGLSGGLIGNSYSATISNCYNSGSVSSGGLSGGLIGQSQSSATNSITINNSYNSGSVSANGDRWRTHCGGLVGLCDYDLTINNSYNKGAIFSDGQSGGLVGISESRSSTASLISNSYNMGVVSSKGKSGGLVGHIQSSSTFIVNNSHNNDSVSSSVSFYSYSGGLVGSAVSALAINDSYNKGVISSNTYSGGLIGNSNSVLTIGNSYNSGEISSISISISILDSSTERNSSGGLVGFCKTDKTNVSVISNSHNSGNISSTDRLYQSYSGGLIGYSSYLNIIESYNLGSVTCSASYPYSGGLVGASISALKINSSFNLGNVSSSSLSENIMPISNCGGLVGHLRGFHTKANFSISNSYNSGSVSSTTILAASLHSIAYSGGLIGVSESRIHLIISNCYANGNVSAIASKHTYGGGLIGLFYSESDLNISNSYFDTETSTQTMIIGKEVDLSNVVSSGGMTTEAFKNKESFNQWFNKTADKDNPWVFNKNGYPYLYWQEVDSK